MPLSQQYGFWRYMRNSVGVIIGASQCRSRSNMVSGIQSMNWRENDTESLNAALAAIWFLAHV